eukprot:m.169340 g.169340  ORF g.169340 m.169340 type:complete len:82 (+) comp10367_c0_seq2:225-470(+)
MDVLLRELTDRDRHDERFPDFLLLTSGVLRNTPLADDPYRLDELQRCLTQLVDDDVPEAERPPPVVRELALKTLNDISSYV